MIAIERVTKRFGRATAVDDVSFSLAEGDSVALWGANGAGKSTIIRCVLGLLRYRGAIRVNGMDAARDGKAVRRLIGYVPQELGFYDDLSVGEAIRFFARLKGLATPRTGGVLSGVGLEGQERKRIRDLSGGMKQRLALAIALLGDPPVLILDEVTASLDACGREEFVGLLSRLADARGAAGTARTMLFASHRLEEIQSLAKRVLTLRAGRIVADEAAGEFVRGHAGGRIMRIRLEAPECAAAIDVLRESGFAARLNGVGVLVPIAESRKAEPLRILTDASIHVSDFDLMHEPGPEPHKEATP
ncbi:MAG TPA: ABC transporter ATP-binding protein [Phycisphaerales bacterium]|nr:ABC transporter ATP-binding protein [Phycisphaerales bacterium]